jgi:O-antigen ligase
MNRQSFPTRGLIACVLLCAAVVVAPLALGGTPTLATLALHVVMASVICLWAGCSRAAFLPALFLLLCFVAPFLQLAPLPSRMLAALAPVSAGAWKISLAGISDAWGSISIDPAETAASARRLLLFTGTVMAVANLALQPRWRNALVTALALSGTLIWILGLVFPVEHNSFLLLGTISIRGPLMPGRTPVEPPVATAGFGFPETVGVAGHEYLADSWTVGDGFGPYIITNHFAGAMTLTLPFVVALWLAATRPRLPDWLRLSLAIAAFAGGAGTVGLLVRSRAGTASFVMATLVFSCLAAPPGLWRRAITALTGCYATAVAVFLFAMLGPFQELEKLFPVSLQPAVAGLLHDGRVVATRVAERMFLASPLFGTGLGTYGDLYPRMVQDGIPWYFAHNEYAQFLAEAGMAGLLFAAIPGVMLVRSAASFAKAATGTDRTFGAAAWAAVAGIATHSIFDWNLRVPANAFLSCIAAGLALASSTGSAASLSVRGDAGKGRSWLSNALNGALILIVITATGFLIRDAVSEVTQRRLREAIAAARLYAADPKAPSATDMLAEAIAAGELMAHWDTGDAQLAVALGQANLHLSSMPMPIDDANACLATAEKWFWIARRNCAACRGLAASQ